MQILKKIFITTLIIAAHSIKTVISEKELSARTEAEEKLTNATSKMNQMNSKIDDLSSRIDELLSLLKRSQNQNTNNKVTTNPSDSTKTTQQSQSKLSLQKATSTSQITKIKGQFLLAAILNKLMQTYLINDREIRAKVNLNLSGRTPTQELDSLAGKSDQAIIKALQDMQKDKSTNSEIMANKEIRDLIVSKLADNESFMKYAKSSDNKTIGWSQSKDQRIKAVQLFLENEVALALKKIQPKQTKESTTKSNINFIQNAVSKSGISTSARKAIGTIPKKF